MANQSSPSKRNYRPVQTWVIHCVKCSRVGRFYVCKKCSELENSLSHCVLRSPSEGGFTREIFFIGWGPIFAVVAVCEFMALFVYEREREKDLKILLLKLKSL